MTHTAQQVQSTGDVDDEAADSTCDAGDALDALVDELRTMLATRRSAAYAEASVAKWLETLLACITRCNNTQPRDDDDADGDAEDIADVLVMVLSACAQNAWRAKEGHDRIGELLFYANNMEQLFRFLAALASSVCVNGVAEQSSAALTACEVLFALGRLAQSESEINCMFGAWQSCPRLCGKLPASLATLQETTRDQRLAICYVRFIDRALLDTNETFKKPSRPMLSELVGDDILRWRQHSWERKCQLISSSNCGLEAFGSENACEAMVKRILQGFSIPQVDADAAGAPLELPSFLVSLNLNELLGLRHRVDVTLVRGGVMHPEWELNDVLQIEDLMNALRNKYTIGIRGVHARSQLIAHVCNALQNELKQHVNANIYWTPPGEQGFNMHIDDHCVFVIQLKGRKNWHLKDHVGALPKLYSDLSEPSASGPTKDLVLEPGSILYIPRGTPHCADTKGLEEDSIHLTIGVEIEEQFTKGALTLELLALADVGIDELHLESIKATMESSMLRNEMRGGLMSWHLEDDSGFQRECAELLTKLKEAFDATPAHEYPLKKDRRNDEIKKLVGIALQMCSESVTSSVSWLRQRLEDDRSAFLSSRQKLAALFTMLHRSFPPDDQTQVPEHECSFHTNKKARR